MRRPERRICWRSLVLWWFSITDTRLLILGLTAILVSGDFWSVLLVPPVLSRETQPIISQKFTQTRHISYFEVEHCFTINRDKFMIERVPSRSLCVIEVCLIGRFSVACDSYPHFSWVPRFSCHEAIEFEFTANFPFEVLQTRFNIHYACDKCKACSIMSAGAPRDLCKETWKQRMVYG